MTTTPITLKKVKDYLNIDFDEYDDQLTSFLEMSISVAENITGKESSEFNADVWGAILLDVGDRFDKGGSYTISLHVTATFRRNSRKPMF